MPLCCTPTTFVSLETNINDWLVESKPLLYEYFGGVSYLWRAEEIIRSDLLFAAVARYRELELLKVSIQGWEVTSYK